MPDVYCSLDCVDLVYTGADGRTRWLQTDHRAPAQIEAEAELSLVYAAIRLTTPRRHFAGEPTEPVLEYRCQHGPPGFLRAAIAATGAELVVGESAEPFPGEPPDLLAIVRLALAGLAARVVAARGLALDLAGLEVLEREQPPLEPDADEVRFWRAAISLSAVAGELLRPRGGGWCLVDDTGALSLVYFTAGGAPVDPIDVALNRLAGDREASLVALLTAVSVS